MIAFASFYKQSGRADINLSSDAASD